MPQLNGRGLVGAGVGITVFVVKAAILQRHGHKIGQGVIQRFSTGIGIVFSGSLLPLPTIVCTALLVCTTTSAPAADRPAVALPARSMKAWAWLTAECALVNVSRIARSGWPGSGKATV